MRPKLCWWMRRTRSRGRTRKYTGRATSRHDKTGSRRQSMDMGRNHEGGRLMKHGQAGTTKRTQPPSHFSSSEQKIVLFSALVRGPSNSALSGQQKLRPRKTKAPPPLSLTMPPLSTGLSFFSTSPDPSSGWTYKRLYVRFLTLTPNYVL